MSRDANYEFIKIIGKGGMATVELWRRCILGKDLVVAKRVYIGEMSKEEEREARQEAHFLRKLEHPHIVRYLGSWVSRETHDLVIVQEHCEGGDLSGAIRRARSEQAPFAAERVIRWVAQLTHALQYCHKTLRMLHRDLKPSNVFLSGDQSRALLGDFGVAKALGSTKSLCNTFIGTEVYMSPEVIRMQKYGLKSDVWGLGSILYEACALRRLFDAKDPVTLVKAIVGADPPPPWPEGPAYPAALQTLCFLMVTRDEQLRPSLTDLLSTNALLRSVVLDLEGELQWNDSLVPPPGPDLGSPASPSVLSSQMLLEMPQARGPSWTPSLSTVRSADNTSAAPSSRPLTSGGGLSAFASGAAERLKAPLPGLASSVPTAAGLDSNNSSGWGQHLPAPPQLADQPPWWGFVEAAGAAAAGGDCADDTAAVAAAAVAVATVADVRDIVELTVRRRELEAAVARVTPSEDADDEEPQVVVAPVAEDQELVGPSSEQPAQSISAANACGLSEVPPWRHHGNLPALLKSNRADHDVRQKAAAIGARLLCVGVLQADEPDPAELTLTLQGIKAYSLGEEACGKAVLLHAHRLQMRAEDIAANEDSRLLAVEKAAEIVEAVQPHAQVAAKSGEPLLAFVDRKLQDKRVEEKHIGLRCRCGPVVRQSSVKLTATLEEVKAAVAKRFERPNAATLVLSWQSGRSCNNLLTEDSWQECLRAHPRGPIEITVPAAKALPKRRDKVSLAGLACTSRAGTPAASPGFGIGRLNAGPMVVHGTALVAGQ